MPKSIITFADDQLAKMISVFAKPSDKSKFNFDTLIKLIQVLAIIAAGAWTIYTYKIFQEKQNDLLLEQGKIQKAQSEFNFKQANLLADTEVKKADVSLQQQEFDLKQKDLLAKTQKETAETSLHQQKLNLTQSRLVSDTQVNLATTSLEQQRLNLELNRAVRDSTVQIAEATAVVKQIEADAARQNFLKVEYAGTLRKKRTVTPELIEYELTLNQKVQNLTSNETHVSVATVETLVGSFDQSNSVRKRYINLKQDGPVRWGEPERVVFKIPSVGREQLREINDKVGFGRSVTEQELNHAIVGEFAVGLLGKGSMSDNDFKFLVGSSSSSLLGVRVNLYCLVDGMIRAYSKEFIFDLSQVK